MTAPLRGSAVLCFRWRAELQGHPAAWGWTLLLAVLALLMLSTAAHTQSSVCTRGYHKKNGTYMAPHHRTRPDRSRANNWSSKGRMNPYTGKKGTVDPYKPKRKRRKH